jgi:hypothetical protein
MTLLYIIIVAGMALLIGAAMESYLQDPDDHLKEIGKSHLHNMDEMNEDD